MKNIDIRQYALEKHVNLWEVSEKLGYSHESAFSRVLRHELTEDKKAEIRAIEAYIKTQSDTLVDLEEKTTKLERKAEIAEMVYDMARGSGGNEDLRDKLIDVMYENEQLKAENSKLRETLNKAYDFMKQFVVDGKNLLERFLESVGQMVVKVRNGLKR